MKIVTPRVFVIGESVAIQEGLESMLEHLGVPDWQTDAESDTEKLSEIAGKLCYMSFDTELNANLTRTGTRNNHDYLQQGIIATKHGSVLEHTVVNLVLLDVSRVLTHELVRHGDGTAFSQECFQRLFQRRSEKSRRYGRCSYGYEKQNERESRCRP